jgi:hypothetical protein
MAGAPKFYFMKMELVSYQNVLAEAFETLANGENQALQ